MGELVTTCNSKYFIEWEAGNITLGLHIFHPDVYDKQLQSCSLLWQRKGMGQFINIPLRYRALFLVGCVRLVCFPCGEKELYLLFRVGYIYLLFIRHTMTPKQ